MRKLMLDMDALNVESFVIEGDSGAGTVRANEYSEGYDMTCACPAPPPSEPASCPANTKCRYTCVVDLATNCLGGGSAYC